MQKKEKVTLNSKLFKKKVFHIYVTLTLVAATKLYHFLLLQKSFRVLTL